VKQCPCCGKFAPAAEFAAAGGTCPKCNAVALAQAIVVIERDGCSVHPKPGCPGSWFVTTPDSDERIYEWGEVELLTLAERIECVSPHGRAGAA
jgi:hypothetical protein